ncbi:MAG TPA: reductase [Microbacterium sp.]|nr:reductase [Microbacterium sp.]
MTSVLILGGTAWLGALIAREWRDAGAAVTCLARGASGSAPDGVAFVPADRLEPGGYDRVAATDWDEVVELAWHPDLVRGALSALAGRAGHWTLVSSVSVYARGDEIGADESARLLEPDDPADYGKAKVAAERASGEALGDRLLVVRPGLIVGPGDRSDRFGYWPARFARAGDERVLVPPLEGAWAQVIDVADLATFVRRAGDARETGAVDAVGEPVPLRDLLAQAADAAAFTGERIEASAADLVDAGVAHWAGPRSLPLWLPADRPGFARRSHAAYDRMGGALRPLSETLERTLGDERARGLDRERRSGLTRAEELEVLERLSSAR